MLSSISWQQFLAVLSILTAAYYGYVGLRYYQKELRGFVNRKPASAVPQSVNSPSSFQIMGVAKQDHGVSIADASDLQFAADDESETENAGSEQPVSANPPVQEPTKELLNDVTHLVEAFKEIDDKPEFLSLLRIQYGSYRLDENAIDWPAVQQRTLQLTRDRLPFEVTEPDLELN